MAWCLIPAHPSDVAIGQQAARGDGFLIFKGDHVDRPRVLLVELDFERHALLFHEHREANRRRVRARFLPRHKLDSQHGAKSIIAA